MGMKIVTQTVVTVASAGTAEQLAENVACTGVIITAAVGNTGVVYIGDVNVDSTNGTELAAGEGFSADDNGRSLINLSSFYVDAATDGDKVRVQTLEKE